MPHSEGYEVIGWRDPSETIPGASTVDEPAKVVRIFAISSPTGDIDAEIIAHIEMLGGQISSEGTKFDANCTHLVTARPTRSEKSLSCIAAGKWFMCPEYVFKSAEHGSFLDVNVEFFFVF